jgi:hypothetical protein
VVGTREGTRHKELEGEQLFTAELSFGLTKIPKRISLRTDRQPLYFGKR